jgi:ribosomal protein S18 acetylase RimI-like enzyme
MYRKFGFMESGRREKYYKDNDEDAILMALENLSGG